MEREAKEVALAATIMATRNGDISVFSLDVCSEDVRAPCNA